MKHTHWELISECGKCGKQNVTNVPVGVGEVWVDCQHCTHGHSYLVLVNNNKHNEVEDN